MFHGLGALTIAGALEEHRQNILISLSGHIGAMTHTVCCPWSEEMVECLRKQVAVYRFSILRYSNWDIGLEPLGIADMLHILQHVNGEDLQSSKTRCDGSHADAPSREKLDWVAENVWRWINGLCLHCTKTETGSPGFCKLGHKN